jgi:hypothetical protein
MSSAHDDRTACAAAASLLHAARATAAWGLLQSGVALAALALAPRPLPFTAACALAGVVLLGVIERWLALRVKLDAGLFDALARGTIASTGALDTALQRLGLRNAPVVPRSLDDRLAGARALLLRHAATALCQSALLAAALLSI